MYNLKKAYLISSIIFVLVTSFLVFIELSVNNYLDRRSKVDTAVELVDLTIKSDKLIDNYYLSRDPKYIQQWFYLEKKLSEIISSTENSSFIKEAVYIKDIEKNLKVESQVLKTINSINVSKVIKPEEKNLQLLNYNIQLNKISKNIMEDSMNVLRIGRSETILSLNTLLNQFKFLIAIIITTLFISLLGVFIFLRKISDQEKKFKTISLDLEKYLLAVDNAYDQIVITDLEGKVLYANKALERYTGYSVDEVIGKKAGVMWGGLMDKSFYENMWKVIKEEKKSFIGVLNNRRKNYEKYVVEAHITPVLDASKNIIFFVSIERDITKEKEIDRMKTEFISMAAHQLRTPLSATKWFSEMLFNGDAGKLNINQQKYLNFIHSSNERMIALVNSLLNVSRIESGRLIVEPSLINIKKLIEDIVVEIKIKTDIKKQKLIIDIDKNIPKIMLDDSLIKEIYINLLTNASKYTPEEGEINLKIYIKDNFLMSQVEDNGYGILDKDKDKIFQKFYRGENVVQKQEGTGLGLYLIKLIVESSGGTIWFESKENKGSTFYFTIPLSGMKKKSGEIRYNG